MIATTTAVGLPIAFFAGLFSFFSPCVLPVVPGYLSVVAGVTPADLDEASTRRVVVPSLIFIGSFSSVYILLGLGATAASGWLTSNQRTLQIVSGILVIAMGLLFALSPFIPQLAREWHPGGLAERAGKGGPGIVGFAFAIAWTPCIGPTLGAILTLAAQSDSTARGGLLLAFYSLGLGVPFLLTALAFGKMSSAFAVVKRHYGVIVVSGGLFLIILGVTILTGQLFVFSQWIQGWLPDVPNWLHDTFGLPV